MKKIAGSAAAFFAGVAVIIIFIMAGSDSPLKSLFEFFIKPFSSVWYFGNMLNKTGLLLFAAMGSLFALKCGCFNLGGEGQIYAAGFLTSLFLQKTWGVYAPFQFIAAMIFVVCISAVFGSFLGFLKLQFNADILLTSFLTSAGLIPLVDYMITGPFRDGTGNLLAMPPIMACFHLRYLMPPSFLNASFFIALLMAVWFILFFAKTKWGYRLSISGKAAEFSKFAGFSAAAPELAGMAVSAGMHGLSGFFAVSGAWHVCHFGFSSGMGWAALVTALIAKQNFAALIPAAFLYAWVQSASDAAVMSGSLGFDTAVFLQAAVFLFISAEVFGARLKKPKREQI